MKREKQAKSGAAKRSAEGPALAFLPRLRDGAEMVAEPGFGFVREDDLLVRLGEDIDAGLDAPAESIPAVLAEEARMRRVLALPPEEAMDRRELARWRGLVALLLLWDAWEKDGSWPFLTLESYRGDESPFTRFVWQGLREAPRAAGLRLFALEKDGDARPLCLLTPATIVTPAADIGDLTALLPPAVRWYDFSRGGFLDPSPFLTAVERARLVAQLRLLAQLGADASLASSIYDESGFWKAVLDSFIQDATASRDAWRHAMAQEDADAWRDMAVRIKATCALAEEPLFPGLEKSSEEVPTERLAGSPLTDALLGAGGSVPPGKPLRQTVWRFFGVPVARESGGWLLEPSGDPGETAALERLAGDLALLEAKSPRFGRNLSARLGALSESLRTRAEVAGPVKRLVEACRRHAEENAASLDAALCLTWPEQEGADARRMLLAEYLGLSDAAAAQQPFSDKALVILDAAEDTLGDKALGHSCRLADAPGAGMRLVAPPLSPALAAALCGTARLADAPALDTTGFAFTLSTGETGDTLDCAMTLCGRGRRVVLRRRYEGARGEIVQAAGTALPTVAVWPSVPLAQRGWRRYFVYAQEVGGIAVETLRAGAWTPGRAVRQGARAWTVAALADYPDYCVLRRGADSLGVLPDPMPVPELPAAGGAVAAVDFGAASVKAWLKLGEQVAPAECPNLTRLILRGASPERVAAEFLPLVPFKGELSALAEIFTQVGAETRAQMDVKDPCGEGAGSGAALDAETRVHLEAKDSCRESAGSGVAFDTEMRAHLDVKDPCEESAGSGAALDAETRAHLEAKDFCGEGAGSGAAFDTEMRAHLEAKDPCGEGAGSGVALDAEMRAHLDAKDFCGEGAGSGVALGAEMRAHLEANDSCGEGAGSGMALDAEPYALVRGHLLGADFGAILGTDPETLFACAGWQEEEGGDALQLALHQVMLQTALAACLHGAQGMSWRWVVPPFSSAERFFPMAQALAAQVAGETGLSPLLGMPGVVLCAAGDALGATLRAEGAAKTCVALDVGDGETRACLWQGGVQRAAMTLPGGVQDALATALAQHPGSLKEDFGKLFDHPQLTEEWKTLEKELAASRGRPRAMQRCAALLDRFLEENLSALMRHMNQRRAQGTCTFTQGVLLAELALRLTLAGALARTGDGVAEVWLCGRGARLLPEDLRARLLRFALPEETAQLRLSGAPGQEVVRGLLDCPEQPSGAPMLPLQEPAGLAEQFLLRMRAELPEAAQLVYPAAYAAEGLSAAARAALCGLRNGAAPAEVAACLAQLRDGGAELA